MKRIRCRLGGRIEIIEFYSMLIAVIACLFIYIIGVVEGMVYLITFGISFFALIIVRLFNQCFAVIELEQNEIILKRLFHKAQKYNKKELSVRCAIRDGGHMRLCSCLMIGELKEKHFYFETFQRRIYKSYFLITLDNDKKRDILLNYFNSTIELPNKEIWESAKNYYKNRCKYYVQNPVRRQLKKIQQFYDFIEKYNNSLTKENDTVNAEEIS